MNKKNTTILPLFIFLLISCSTKQPETSKYEDLFLQPIFSKITDSINHEPKNDLLYFRRAVLLNTNNYSEPALEDFKKAWSLKKDERYALGISNILLDTKPDAAIDFLKTALTHLPSSFLLQLTLAKAYNAKGNLEDALTICNQMLATYPQQVDVLKLKAEILNSQGNSDASIQILENAYTLTPYDIELNYALANAYAENNNPKVLHLCDSLIKVDSLGQFAEPFYLKGIYFSNIHDDKKAMAMFNTAIQKNYTFLNAYIEKGKIIYEQHQYNEAFKIFQLSSTIKPTFSDAYYWMGMCQEATGDKDNAYVNFNRAYELDKTFAAAKEAMERVKK